MRLYIFLGIALLSLIFQKNTPASYHFNNEPDEAFISLGKKFPIVGYFSHPSEPPFASGTLVDVGIPELNNRVVITCAHIFDDIDMDSDETLFTCGDDKLVKGKAFICPQYIDLHGAGNKFYDIAIFVLERPLLSVLSVPADDASRESLISKSIISVGYGEAGHYLGRYGIEDLEKRASYSYVHPSWNQKTNNCLTLTPSKNGAVINEHTPRDFSYVPSNAPVGLLGPGDSGGGCFNERSMFVGVISNSSADYFEKEYVLKKECYEKYKDYYDDPECDYSRGYSLEYYKKHKAGTPFNVSVKLPVIVSDINPCFTSDTKNIFPGEELSVYSNMVLFSAHKRWIITKLRLFEVYERYGVR